MLDRQTVERALGVSGDGPILVGLSGGGDSVALLRLLRERCGAAKLAAVIVDHALRDGSGADAQKAKAIADALGVAAEIATLTWPSGPRRAQQSARDGRYAALCDAARRIGARVIALAHTGDDQAETVLMRAAANSGWRGLAGMAAIAPAPLWPQGRGLVLARPLLGVRRASLRAYLREECAEWIEDPANANLAFERVRARALLARLEGSGFEPGRLGAVAKRLRVMAQAVDGEAASFIAAAVRFEGGEVAIAPAWRRLDPEVRRRVLSVLIAAGAGASREPPLAGLARLEAAAAVSKFSGATLHGAQVSPENGGLRIVRDRGALLGRAGSTLRPPPLPLPLPPSGESVWDGRLALRAPGDGWRVEPGAPQPVLRCGEQSLPLAAWDGEVHWLLSAHAGHLLSSRG